MNPLDSNALDTLFLKARTANGFQDRPVARELLERVYELAALAPTSMNTQPARYVFLSSPAARERLLPAMMPGNLEKTRSAPVTVIVATDTRFYEFMPKVWHREGAKENFESNPALATATATRNAVNRRQADKNVAAYSQAVQQQAPPPQQYAPPAQEYYEPPVQQDDTIAQLERLGALYAQGLLTDNEFAAQKAKLLGT